MVGTVQFYYNFTFLSLYMEPVVDQKHDHPLMQQWNIWRSFMDSTLTSDLNLYIIHTILQLRDDRMYPAVACHMAYARPQKEGSV